MLTLNHKVFDYSVKFTSFVAKSFLEAVKIKTSETTSDSAECYAGL